MDIRRTTFVDVGSEAEKVNGVQVWDRDMNDALGMEFLRRARGFSREPISMVGYLGVGSLHTRADQIRLIDGPSVFEAGHDFSLTQSTRFLNNA